jgi:ubiquitin C-terminal hydrolase
VLTSCACNRICKAPNVERAVESGALDSVRAKYLFRSSMAATNGIDVLISASSSASGSQNVGDRCYLNSILQCLSRTPLLMANFAVEHGTSSAAVNCLRGLTKLTSMPAVQGSGNASKDLANLLTCIQEKLQRTARHSPAVENIFSGVYNSRLTCLWCGCCSQLSGEQFNHLNIAVAAGNATSVPDAVAAFTAAELLTSEHRWECVACKMKAQVRQHTIYAVSYHDINTY